jgi:ribonuclease VapC
VRFVVDTSAVIAVRQGEPEGAGFERLLIRGEPVMSVATLTELTLVWQSRFGARALLDLDRSLATYEVRVEPVEAADRLILRVAVERFAKGRRAAPACLNFGDLFAYALARRLNLPLLAKGDDFAQTDVMPVEATG